ncbi:ABC transporter permease subunit [Acuticoccus kandeliae]|uniref:ABC transporter permease subunit n=1 Tax=Acuticoccus kandeliae TaxID=2073160 RepID=UPI000D3E529A|nr:ABC transporter permease subunit [Acuticoccus kandeliae]
MSVTALDDTEAGAPRPRWRFARPSALWLVLPGVLFLVYFFAWPVARLLLLSLTDQTGAFSLENYERIAQTDLYVRVLGITFRIALMTAAVSLLVGYPVAYWLNRQPSIWRGKLLMFVMVPFWTSYLVKTFAWMILLGRTGVINDILTGSGLVERPVSLMYNQLGIMIGMVHAMVPLAVITMLPIMANIDRRLGNAAMTLGATPAHAFWLIFFRLSLPGVTAAGLLVFIFSLGFFIVPAFLGGSRNQMLAQLVITQIQELLNWQFAGALATLMLVAALVTCFVYDRLFGISTVTGGSGRSGSGWSRALANWALCGVADVCAFIGRGTRAVVGARASAYSLASVSWFVIAFLVVPTLLIFPLSFTSSSFLSFPPPGWSLQWYQTFIESPLWTTATIRSFGVGFATAIAATAIGGFAALGLFRMRSRWSPALFAFFLAPMIVPRIVIAVGIFYLYAQIGLVGTDLGLVIGHTVLAIPFTLIAVSAILKTYDTRLDQAAATLGANPLKTLTHVTIPLISGGLVAAFLLAFITSFDELTIAIFVSGGIKTTLPKQMWDDMLLQLNPTLAAVSVVVFVIVTALLLIAERFRRTD